MQIKTIDNKGIYLTHDDGLTFSIQFGPGNYCENYDNDYDMGRPNTSSKDCEVAVWTSAGKEGWVTKDYFKDAEDGDCSVVGRVPIEEALRIAINRTKVGDQK